MTLDEKIAYEEKKSEVRPKTCKGCKYVFTEKGKYGNHFCKLIHGSYEEECVNYCVSNDITAYNCPLLTEDKAKHHRQLADWLKELKELREQKRPHGEWVARRNPTTGQIYCSVCGSESSHDSYGDCEETDFCPNCGASMSANDRQVTDKLDENTQKHYGFREKY